MVTKMYKISIVLTLLLLVSCAYNSSMVKTSYKVLSVSQTSYNTSMKVVAALYSRGIIDSSEKAMITRAAQTYHDAHNAATEALAIYAETKSAADKDNVEKQIEVAGEALTKFLKLLEPYLED